MSVWSRLQLQLQLQLRLRLRLRLPVSVSTVWRSLLAVWLSSGGYNYIAFDIANHFCEYAGFDFDLERWYPSMADQVCVSSCFCCGGALWTWMCWSAQVEFLSV